MAIKVSIQNVLRVGGGQGALFVSGLLIPSGNYSTGGDTVDFTQAVADPALVGGAGPFLDSSLGVENFDAWSMAGNLVQGYIPVLGTKQNNCKLMVVTDFGVQLAAGAYPAGVTGDTIGFNAILGNLI